jgi:hypothetical protein
MRWTVPLLAAALACAPYYPDPDAPAPGTCPEVVVENQGWYDVVVYYEPLGAKRLGYVTGNTTSTLPVCSSEGMSTRFIVRPFGGRTSVPVEGVGVMTVGEPTQLVVAPSSRFSYVIGDGFGAADTEIRIVGMEWLFPRYMHLGIWADVANCAGQEGAPADVAWAVADTIADTDGNLLYGATVFEHWDATVIVIERPYWLHPTVISHEILHALGAAEDDGVMGRCVMYPPDGPLVGRTR